MTIGKVLVVDQFGGKIISELEKGGLIFYNVNPFVNGNPWTSSLQENCNGHVLGCLGHSKKHVHFFVSVFTEDPLPPTWRA